MILVTDSGSTKTDWRWHDADNNQHQAHSAGYNPFHVDAAFIARDIGNCTAISDMASSVSAVYFYGAGCSAEPQRKMLSEVLKSVFINAAIDVQHDLLGAARAVYQGEPCYVSILGTGSNCSFFDGISVASRLPSLGFLLGDEASGNWFGKQVLRDFFYQRLPLDLALDLDESLRLHLPETLDRLYHQPRPNAFLASVMPVLYRHRSNPYVQQLLHAGFSRFIELHLLPFEPDENPCHFVGSVAWYFKEELTQAMSFYNLETGQIIQAPIVPLLEFHEKGLY